MKIALVDDSPIDRQNLRKSIIDGFQTKGINISELKEYESGDNFINHFSTSRFDVVVLDIFMGSTSGVEVAKKIRAIDDQVKIIFCTSSNDFASEAFGVNACYYILKPVDADKVTNMIPRLNLAQFFQSRDIVLPDGQKLLVRSIMYTQCMDHVIFLHLNNGTTIKTRLQQSRLEIMLSSFPQFFSCSKGLIVNFNYVSNKTGSMFLMKDGTTLPISRRKAKETTASFENFMFEQLNTSINL